LLSEHLTWASQMFSGYYIYGYYIYNITLVRWSRSRKCLGLSI